MGFVDRFLTVVVVVFFCISLCGLLPEVFSSQYRLVNESGDIFVNMSANHKIPPPVFKPGRSYRLYKTELKLWEAVTTLPAEKRAAVIVLALPDDGNCRLRTIILEKVPQETLTGATGLGEVVKILDELLGKDELEECMTDYEEFEDYTRTNETMNEYIIVFGSKYEKVKAKGITLPPQVLAFKLIRKANISSDNKKIVLTGLDYAQKDALYTQAQTSLKKFCGQGRRHTDTASDAVTIKTEVLANTSARGVPIFRARGRGGFRGRGFWPHQDSSSDNWRGRGSNWRGAAPSATRGGYYTQGSASWGSRGNVGTSSAGSSRGGASRADDRPLNPLGTDGRPMLCKGCGTFRHFLNDCPYSYEQMKKSTSVNVVEEQHDMNAYYDQYVCDPYESAGYEYGPNDYGQYPEVPDQNDNDQDPYITLCAEGGNDTLSHSFRHSFPSTCEPSPVPSTCESSEVPSTYHGEKPNTCELTSEPYTPCSALYTGRDLSQMSNFVAEALGCAVLDTACGSTVCGTEWFDSYVEQISDSDKQKIHLVGESGVNSFKFGAGPVIYSVGTYEIPVVLAGKHVMLKTDVVPTEVPLLLSKSAMKRAGVVIDMNQDIAVIFGETVPLNTTSSGHYCIPLIEAFPVCEVTEVISEGNEDSCDMGKTLLKLHRQFGHPTEKKLITLLKDAQVWKEEYRGLMNNVYDKCRKSGLCRFKDKIIRPVVALPMAKDFNDKVAIDLKQWGSKWILHIVDMWSRFTVSVFVDRKQPKNIIDALLTDWCGVFGFMKSVLSDNGGEFWNAELQEVQSMLDVEVLTTAAESPFQNGLCERNHQIVDSILAKLVQDYPGTSQHILLKWACMAKNSMQMVEGFSPYQLVIGRNPRLPNITDSSPSSLEDSTQSETFAKHLNSLHAARKEFTRTESCQRIKTALRHRVRASEVVFHPGERVYYKRDRHDRWFGPAKVIFQDGKVVFVRHGANWIKVSLNRLVKSGREFVQHPGASIADTPDDTVESSDSEEEVPVSSTRGDVSTGAADAVPEARENVVPETRESAVLEKNPVPETSKPAIAPEHETRRSLRKFNKEQGAQLYCVQHNVPSYVYVSDVPRELHKSPEVLDAKKEELEKLNIFDVYDEVEDKGQPRIDTRWVVTYKGSGVKARIVARGFQDLDPVPSDSPTVAKTAMRSMISVAAFRGWQLNSTDIKSAFLQGRDLERDIYLKPPKEAAVAPGMIWKLKKSLYGLNDGARQFYLSLRDELTSLGCVVSSVEPSLFIYIVNSSLSGMLISHIDDFLHAGDMNFENSIMTPLRQRFVVGRVERDRFRYIGFDVTQGSSGVLMSMNSYVAKHQDDCQKLKTGGLDRQLCDTEQTAYRGIIGRLNWVAQGARPDKFFDVIDLSTKLKQATVKDLNHATKLFIKLQEYDSVVMFPTLHGDLSLKVFTDAALGNLSDQVSSTCGILVFLGDQFGNVCVLTWRANKIKRVARSTLAAEAMALQEGIDEAIYTRTLLSEMMPSMLIPIDVYTDNKSLVDSIRSTKLVDDRRLRIDMGALKQVLDSHIRDIIWVPGERQLADCLTKKGAKCDALLGVFHSGKLM